MSTVAIKCVSCGCFIPFGEMVEGGGARHEFEPLSEFGPERSEWVCARCVKKERRADKFLIAAAPELDALAEKAEAFARSVLTSDPASSTNIEANALIE